MNTVRAAYAKLETDGLVQTRHGVGTVVVESAPRAAAGGAVAFGANTIAVLIGGLDPFYLPLLRGIEEVASERGTLVLIVDTRDSASLAQAMIRRLVARGVDGIIAVSIGDLPPDRSGPDDTPLPIVYVDQPDRRGYSLVFDGADAGYTATDHLRRHGHDRIGFVTAPLVWHNVAELHHGYLRALESSDVVPSPELVAEVPDFTVEAGRVAMARLLELPDPPSAIFAGGSNLALGAMAEARARGLRVPHDLAIVGYTDSPLASLVDPALTVVEVPAGQIGVRAMHTLSDLIQGKRPRRRRTVLAPQLVVRDSCGSHPL